MKTINKYILIFLGLCMFCTYIWLRFVRERLPKDIPINLSIMGFIILIEICCIYGYIVYILFKKNHTTNPILIYIRDQIYKPLIAFDNFLKKLPGVEPIYLKFMVYISYKFNVAFKETSIFYFIFAIFPRLILITALVIDTFYFHKLYYIYKVLLIGILLFLRRYIIYSFKHAKELLIKKGELYISSITMTYIDHICTELYGDDEFDDDVDEDDKGWIPPTMSIPLRKFIEIQTNAIVYANKQYDYMITRSENAWEEIRIKYNLVSTKDITQLMIRQENKERELRIIDNIMKLAVIIKHYYIVNDSDERYKNIKKLIFSNYLICWFYILISSMHMLSEDSVSSIFNIVLGSLLLFTLLTSHIYSYYIYNKGNKIDKEDCKVGMLRIYHGKEILLSLKLVIVIKDNILLIVGYLINKANEDNKDTNRVRNLIYTEDEQKEEELYFNAIKNPWIIRPEDFSIIKKYTDYIQNSNVIQKINKLPLQESTYYQHNPIEETIEYVNEFITSIKSLERHKKQAEDMIRAYLDPSLNSELEEPVTDLEFIQHKDSFKFIEDCKEEELNKHAEIRWLIEYTILKQQKYKVGKLQIDHRVTRIASFMQRQLVIIFTEKKDLDIVIGYLDYNSSNEDNDIEIRSVTFIIPRLVVGPEHIITNDKITKYIQNNVILNQIDEEKDKVLKHTVIPYSPIGFTIEDINKILAYIQDLDNTKREIESIIKEYQNEPNKDPNRIKIYEDKLNKLNEIVTLKENILNEYKYIINLINELLLKNKEKNLNKNVINEDEIPNTK